MAFYTVFSDGAARGNPGPAGAGYVIYAEDGGKVAENAIPLGITTNNVAEYTAVIEGAKAAAALLPDKVFFKLDSELIVKQVLGKYRVKDEKLKPLFLALLSILKGFDYEIAHVPRERNKEADRLSNIGADMNV